MAKNLMIQGTMSNVGKSLITAGILRVLWQDGYRVAPFKSQNMALNSYITEDGLEMGRAQVIQAEAAGILPEVCMNPILLKPTTDIGSQVIVNGEVLGTYSAREYFKIKKGLIPKILRAYQSLEERYDVVVIEGAGSPAEMNLKADDIVNMGLAKIVDAPVLLIGDIDRGGVFAQLYGTITLLEEEERARIKGLIVNKFRGDRNLFEDGIIFLEERCQKKVLGVLPFLPLDLEEEDSLSERFLEKKAAFVTIGVIRFPHISNFTDLNPLEALEAVSVEYITKISDWKEFDFILLPGTKSTIADLIWLRESGLEGLIQKAAKQGTLIMGICGGYQMLGEEIIDKNEMEGILFLRGMGLLPVKTEFSDKKVRSRKSGQVCIFSGAWSGICKSKVSGYEIHMGKTERVKKEQGIQRTYETQEQKGQEGAYFSELWDLEREKRNLDNNAKNLNKNKAVLDGWVKDNIFGTYLHGIFEETEFRQALADLLYQRCGISCKRKESRFDWKEYKEEQYNKLADMVREHMDMEQIYRIIGLK